MYKLRKSSSIEIVKNVFVFGIYPDSKLITDSLLESIELELKKPLNTITDDDINTVKEIVLKFDINEQLYIIERFLEYYELDNLSENSHTFEKLLANHVLDKLRKVFLSILAISLNEEEEDIESLTYLEKFEKENNMTIYEYE